MKNSSCPGDSRRPHPRSQPGRRPRRRRPAPRRAAARADRARENPGTRQPFRRRRSGLGAGERKGSAGRRSFFAGATLALLDGLRRNPPAAGALRPRLALQSAAASAKLLRLNGDEGALRDLRFAVGDAGPAARLLQLWRDLAGRPPGLDLARLAAAAAASTWPWTRTASQPA